MHVTFGDQVIFGGVDENGNPVKRTKDDHPYSYDDFIIYRGHPNEVGNITLWSDRLQSQYNSTWNDLLKKHFNETGENFTCRNPKQIEAFLKELLNDPELKLVYIMEGCNQANGFPVWRFKVYLTQMDKSKG